MLRVVYIAEESRVVTVPRRETQTERTASAEERY